LLKGRSGKARLLKFVNGCPNFERVRLVHVKTITKIKIKIKNNFRSLVWPDNKKGPFSAVIIKTACSRSNFSIGNF